MRAPPVATHDITVDFGGLRAVDSVSLSISRGERLAVIGPNGAGKTTLFSCITGSRRPTSGSVEYGGRDVTRVSEHRRAALGNGRTYQITNVFMHLTVLDNVLLAVHGTTRRKWVFLRPVSRFTDSIERAQAELDRFGLAHRADRLVKELSYGERRQLEFALAMASDPEVLLLDEPCAGLSPAERERVSQIISEMPRTITLMIIEHNMDIAMGLVDRVLVLHNGRLILEGTPDEVRSNPLAMEVYLGGAQ